MTITSRNSWNERYPLPSLSASVNMDSTKSESGFRPSTLANSTRVSSHCKASLVLLLKSPASLLSMSKTWSQKTHVWCYYTTLWHDFLDKITLLTYKEKTETLTFEKACLKNVSTIFSLCALVTASLRISFSLISFTVRLWMLPSSSERRWLRNFDLWPTSSKNKTFWTEIQHLKFALSISWMMATDWTIKFLPDHTLWGSSRVEPDADGHWILTHWGGLDCPSCENWEETRSHQRSGVLSSRWTQVRLVGALYCAPTTLWLNKKVKYNDRS